MTQINRTHCYDVFLSFTGEDTRRTFTGHLLAALERKNLHTFIDDSKLRRGENISDELSKAIRDSKVSIVVFSKNYATSRWCLDELLEIINCKKMVLPVFYGVEAEDVLAEDGCYAKALAEHRCNKVEAWRAALCQAANPSAFQFSNSPNAQEPEFVEKIVEDVLKKLNPIELSVVDYPIGLENRLFDLHKLLDLESNDVRILAICGTAGIGKTTLARQLFNSLHQQFHAHVFLDNVKETSKQTNGIVSLQRKLLSSITKNDTHRIENEHHGIKVLEKRVWDRKVFVVLDDVDSIKQLRALAMDRRDKFCGGSRVILTTRDILTLKSLHLSEDVEVYDVPELDTEESLELFSWHAFKKRKPLEEYTKLSHRVVGYGRGLPLVLESLGSFLYGKTLSEWSCELKKLDKIPHSDNMLLEAFT